MKLQFDCHYEEVSMRASIKEMSAMDTSWLLYALLMQMAPEVGEEGYEEFQLATEVILKRCGKELK